MGSLLIVIVVLLAVAVADASSLSVSSWTPPDRAAEREALVDLFRGTGGPFWTQPWNTSAGVDHCTWAGVCCTALTFDPSIPGDLPYYECWSPANGTATNLTVVGLTLTANNITGSIPESIGALFGLLTVEITNTGIGGSLPAAFGNLTLLRSLAVPRNRLVAPVPDLSALDALKFLILSDNYLSGPIGNNSFPVARLEQFSIRNQISLVGVLPFAWLARCAALLTADFTGTALQQPSRDAVAPMAFSTTDRELFGAYHMSCARFYYPAIQAAILVDPTYYFYENCSCDPFYTGTVPECTINPADVLRRVYEATGGPNWQVQTGWTQLSPAPTTSTSTTTPTNDDAGVNDVNVCTMFGVCCGSLTLLNTTTRTCDPTPGRTVVGLDLGDNNLVGTVPSEIAVLEYLRAIAVGGNRLTGTIPPEILDLEYLVTLNLSHNAVVGGFPVGEIYSTKLEELYLSQNRMDTSFAQSMSAWRNLRILHYDGNHFAGPLWGSMFSTFWTALTDLSMVGCSISSTLPAELFNLTQINSIALTNNRLYGPIELPFPFPFPLARPSSLETLQLGANQLNGTLPTELTALMNVGEFDLHGNAFSGPVSSANLPPNVTTLNLSGNPGLTGDLPFTWIEANAQLMFLNLTDTGLRPQNVSEMDKYLFFDKVERVPFMGGRFSCPAVYAQGHGSTLLHLAIDPSAYAYRDCYCAPGYTGGAPICEKKFPTVDLIAGIFAGVLGGAIAVFGAVVGYRAYRARRPVAYKTVV